MLIHIDKSAAADAASDSTTADQSHEAIEHLLAAHREGSHVVSLAREDAQALLAAPLDWSKAARWSLRHIAENHPLIAGLRHDVSWSMELGIGAGFDGQSHDLGGGRKVIRAPLSVFDHRRKTSCCALLGENRTDADLFVELGLMMLAARRWERLDVCHEPRGGGGSTTVIEFQGMADQGRVVLAVADTD